MSVSSRWLTPRRVASAALLCFAPALNAQTFTPKGKEGGVPAPKSSAVPRPRPRVVSRGVDHISAAKMDSALKLVTIEQGRGASLNGSRDGRVDYVMNRRTELSAIEVHCQWDDILVVKSGEGMLRHGAMVAAPKRVWNYEWRAQRIEQAIEVPLLPGDVVRIPAGEAHQLRSSGATPLVYLTIKLLNSAHEGCSEYPYEGK